MTGDSDAAEVEAFTAMFSGPPGEAQREARDNRALRERRAQMSEKQRQRQRKAIRTAQINFRCSPAFLSEAKAMAQEKECSIADLMEQALEALKRQGRSDA